MRKTGRFLCAALLCVLLCGCQAVPTVTDSGIDAELSGRQALVETDIETEKDDEITVDISLDSGTAYVILTMDSEELYANETGSDLYTVRIAKDGTVHVRIESSDGEGYVSVQKEN